MALGRAPAMPVDISNPPDELAKLSAEQWVTVWHTLEMWRAIYRHGNGVNLDISRLVPGAIPTWGDWSGCDWVRAQSCQHRAEMFKRHGEMHITTMMHLALPPGWNHRPACTAEVIAMSRYGFWKTEMDWIPPPDIASRTVWVERRT